MMNRITFEAADMIDRATGGIFAHAERMLETGDEDALRICLDIVRFLQDTGAVVINPQGNKRADFNIILQFFCGVLRYSPHDLRKTCIADLGHAFKGYKRTFRQEGLRETLMTLMKEFPDGGTR